MKECSTSEMTIFSETYIYQVLNHMTCLDFIGHYLENQKYKSPYEIFRNFCFPFISRMNIIDGI
jgi:hypothetical protein